MFLTFDFACRLFLIIFDWSLVLASCTIFFIINPVFAVLLLVLSFIFVGFYLIVSGLEYIGLVYIIVYVGAIAILFLFAIALLETGDDLISIDTPAFGLIEGLMGFIFFLIVPEFLVTLLFPVDTFVLVPSSFYDFVYPVVNTDLLLLGYSLYNVYFLYVIGCGFLLLLTLVGVVLLLYRYLDNNVIHSEVYLQLAKKVLEPVRVEKYDNPYAQLSK